MSKFLALIVASAMALFIAGPAMAAEWTVEKSYTFDKENIVTGDTDIKVKKDIDITVEGDLDAEGGIEVQGDVVFKEIDVQVQDEEVVNKFFELDDSASSTWSIKGLHGLNAFEQLQTGADNFAYVSQLGTPAPPGSDNIMNVGLQYQVGRANAAGILQTGAGWPVETVPTSNFAKQIQIGELNSAFTFQNKRSLNNTNGE